MKQSFDGILLVIGCLAGAVMGATEWSIKSYPCLSHALSQGFEVEGKGRIYLPDPPTEEAASIQAFIQRSSLVFREHLLRGLPEGSLVVLDRKRNTLAARSTVEGHQEIEAMLEDWSIQPRRMVTIQVTILEVPNTDLAALLDETVGKGDHTAQLERLVESGARVVASTKLETRSGQRATTEMGTLLSDVTKFAARADGSTEAASREQELVGLIVEVDPVVGYDGRTLDLNVSVTHSSKAGESRAIPLGTLADKRVEGAVQDFTTERWLTGTTLISGQSRLLGSAPAEDPTMTRLCFLTAVCATVQLPKDPRAETWLKMHGDSVEKIPELEKKAATGPSVPAGMVEKSFRVPRDFLSIESPVGAPVDPFGVPVPEPRVAVRISAKDILKEQGISFPDGSSAVFSKEAATLKVVNLPANLDLVETFVDSINEHFPAVLQLRAHIVEAGSALVRKLARESLGITDHQNAWQALQAEIAAGRGRVVESAAIDAQSGQRSKVESGRLYAWANPQLTAQVPEAKADEKSVLQAGVPTAELVAEVEREPLGLQFEIDPVLGADGVTLDLSTAITRQSRPPTEHFAAAESQPGTQTVDAPSVDFHPQKLVTSFTTMGGMWRMIGTWQPVGADGKLDPAVMQAIFIQAVVLRVGE